MLVPVLARFDDFELDLAEDLVEGDNRVLGGGVRFVECEFFFGCCRIVIRTLSVALGEEITYPWWWLLGEDDDVDLYVTPPL